MCWFTHDERRCGLVYLDFNIQVTCALEMPGVFSKEVGLLVVEMFV